MVEALAQAEETRARGQGRRGAPVQQDHGDVGVRGGVRDHRRRERGRVGLEEVEIARHQKTRYRLARAASAATPSASMGATGWPSAFQSGVRRRGAGLDVEDDAELLERGAELGDVVAVHEIVGVRVEQVGGGPAEHHRHLVLARHHAERDAHGLVGAVGHARILRDHHEHGLAVGHAISSARRSGRCR